MKQITIPADIGSKPYLDAVSHYHDDFGWVIHPLKGPSGGGKQPIIKGWRRLSTDFLTPEKKIDYFSRSNPC